MSEQVIELSIEETNKLRAELGLAPLRVTSSGKTSAAASLYHHDNPDTDGQSHAAEETFTARRSDDNVLELSIEETNKLRAKLGLPPLREASSSVSQSSRTVVVHAPANQADAEKAAADRIEKARLERQVKEGMEKFAAQKSLAEEGERNALSWAQQMRSKKQESSQKTITFINDDKKETKKKYSEEDVKGLRVAHNLSEIEQGSETILTLQDASLLETDDVSRKVLGLREDYDEDVELENVKLAEQRITTDALRQKRKLELGMGRAGGYAGFDDDEFEELGGSQTPSRLARGTLQATDETQKKKKKSRGFQIGAMLEEQEAQQESDLFAGAKGKSVSLQPSQADVTMSDYMTEEEAKAEQSKTKKKKDKSKDKKEFKKQKKDKKDKKKKRANLSEDEEDEEEQKLSENTNKGILDELEATAVADDRAARKRRRSDKDEEDLIKETNPGDDMDLDKFDKEKAEKRAKFAAAMAKSSERTRQAFQSKEKRAVPATSSHIDEEPDDAFLNAALAKARRLNRLKEMAESKKPVRGAEAVVEAINAAKGKQDTASSGGGTVVFEVDETREFTRALRAKGNQTERDQAKKASKSGNVSIKKEDGGEEDGARNASVDSIVKQKDVEEDADMEELAKEVEEDEEGVGALDGATGTSMAVGRGLGGVLSMLKQTGELTRRNAGREEMRGRAKDKRTYEDYEPLDLSTVVKIDGRTATEKDKDLASREVKLEYRDKHGRLLTRHEAFRELSYQFHGYGSGKRKEEKKKEQIAREQAEARLASRQASEGGGVFGALMATQKATGKAFVVHKT